MKKLWVMLLTLVLTVSALTACGCTPQDMNVTTEPTRATTPSVPATSTPTTPATRPATEPETSVPTTPLPSEDGSETGIIGSEEATTGTENATGPMAGRNMRGRGIR